MTDMSKFASRFHKLKRTVQNMAELELAQSQSEHAATLEKLQATREKLFEAQNHRMVCTNGADWMQWQQYIAALEMTEQSQQVQVDRTSDNISRTREKVVFAHRETMKWETFRDIQIQLHREAEESVRQTEQDERAVMRYERGRE